MEMLSHFPFEQFGVIRRSSWVDLLSMVDMFCSDSCLPMVFNAHCPEAQKQDQRLRMY